MANSVADELAGYAAELAQVEASQQEDHKRRRNSALQVAGRLAKVALSAAEHHKAQLAKAKEAGQQLAAAPSARRLGVVAKLRASTHKMRSILTSRGLRWRCTACSAVCRKGSHHFYSFLKMACPGNPRGQSLVCRAAAYTRVHGTHRLVVLGELWVCAACGASAKEALKGLGRCCPGTPKSCGSRAATLHSMATGFKEEAEELEFF